MRSFLEVSCWLPVLTEPLSAAVTGGRAPVIPPELEALPIVPVASRPDAFRYPPLLSRVLQQETRRRGPDAATSSCRRAAEACRDTGELVTAIELFLRAACTDDAADACADLAARDESSLRRVDEVLRASPEVTPMNTRWLAWCIRAAVAAGRVEEAVRLLEQAGRGAPSGVTPGEAGSHDLVIARAVVAEQVGDASDLLACADRLLVAVGETGASPRTVRRAHGWRVRALLWAGDMDGAKQALRALDLAEVESAPAAAVDIELAHAWISWFEGDIAGTTDIVAAAEPQMRDGGSGSAELALLAGSVHRERNRLAKAVPLLKGAATSSHHVVAALAASELARCHHAAGAEMKALELVVSTRAAHSDLPSAVDVRLRSTEVRLRLQRGEVDTADDIAGGASPGVDAQLLATRVALQRAPAEVRQIVEAIGGATTPRQAVERLLVRAQLPDVVKGDESSALTEAIAVGAPLGFVRAFLDEGPALNQTLSQLAHECTDRAVGCIAALAAHELALRAEGEQNEPVEQLTPRELAVLRMLPLRMSNREMAAQLYISVNTLKTHVRAIYRKLDVPHRSAAVRRATALQLV